MKNKGILAFGMMMAMMDTKQFGILPQEEPLKFTEKKQEEPPIPKGCKEYWFREDGSFETERILRTKIFFKCYAINNKSAIKKFNSFMRSNKQEPDINQIEVKEYYELGN